MKPLTLALVALALSGSGLRPQDVVESDATPFALAVVRRDGVLLPFASFDGKRWTNRWPAPRPKLEVPISLRDVPKDWWARNEIEHAWTLWPLTGDPRALRVIAPEWVPAHCLMGVGLKTDFASALPPPPRDVHPYPKDGLATAGDVRVEPITVLDGFWQDWTEVQAGVATAFNIAEMDAIRRYRQWTHPVGRNEREAGAVKLEALYRAPFIKPGSFVYYFEATRRYEQHDKSGKLKVGLITFVAGWLIRAPEGPAASVDLHGDILSLDMGGAEFMLPLGVMRIEGVPHWVVQLSGWDRERYLVVEISPTRAKPLIVTWGGWC